MSLSSTPRALMALMTASMTLAASPAAAAAVSRWVVTPTVTSAVSGLTVTMPVPVTLRVWSLVTWWWTARAQARWSVR